MSRTVIATGIALSSGVALADQSLTDYRRAVTESVGVQTEPLVAIIKGQVP
jgi:hypothetical protein